MSAAGVSVEYHYDPASRELRFSATIGEKTHETVKRDVAPERAALLAAELVRAAAEGHAEAFGDPWLVYHGLPDPTHDDPRFAPAYGARVRVVRPLGPSRRGQLLLVTDEQDTEYAVYERELRPERESDDLLDS